MTNEEINNLQIIYKYLKKAMETERASLVYGYISNAMSVIETVIKKERN